MSQKTKTPEPTWRPMPYDVGLRIHDGLRDAQKAALAEVVGAMLDALENNYALGWLGSVTGDDALAARARRLREQLHDPEPFAQAQAPEGAHPSSRQERPTDG